MLLVPLACVSHEAVDSHWVTVARDEPGGFLGLAEGPIVVGSDVGHGPGAWQLDTDWHELPLEDEGDLWWAHAVGEVVWLVGDGGRVLRVERDRVTKRVVDSDVTLFGVWGDEDEVVVVGAGERGRSWRVGEAVTELTANADALFKVWGDGEQTWAVGDGVHRLEGDAWTRVADWGPLFTVHDGVAVGGLDAGLIVELEGGEWVDRSVVSPPLTGVFRRDGCGTVAVGRGGTVLVDGVVPVAGLPTPLDLHGVRVDPDCAIWVAGGALSTTPATHGFLAVLGAEAPTLDDPRTRRIEPPEVDPTDRFLSGSATCEDDIRAVRVVARGLATDAELILHGPDGFAARHTLSARSWEGQYAWTEWGVDLSIPADSPLECSAPSTYLFDVDGDCGVFGDATEPFSDCQAIPTEP